MHAVLAFNLACPRARSETISIAVISPWRLAYRGVRAVVSLLDLHVQHLEQAARRCVGVAAL